MGYYVETAKVDVTIPAAKLPEALQALKDLNKPENNHLKTGGSSTGEKWFAWMDADYDQKLHSVSEIFEELGFINSFENETGFELGYYDNKTGNEEVFLRAVAPFVDAGSEVEFRGEDGEVWKYVFDGQTMRTLHGQVMYSDDIAALKRGAKEELAEKLVADMASKPVVVRERGFHLGW